MPETCLWPPWYIMGNDDGRATTRYTEPGGPLIRNMLATRLEKGRIDPLDEETITNEVKLLVQRQQNAQKRRADGANVFAKARSSGRPGCRSESFRRSAGPHLRSSTRSLALGRGGQQRRSLNGQLTGEAKSVEARGD